MHSFSVRNQDARSFFVGKTSKMRDFFSNKYNLQMMHSHTNNTTTHHLECLILSPPPKPHCKNDQLSFDKELGTARYLCNKGQIPHLFPNWRKYNPVGNFPVEYDVSGVGIPGH